MSQMSRRFSGTPVELGFIQVLWEQARLGGPGNPPGPAALWILKEASTWVSETCICSSWVARKPEPESQ